MADIVDSVDKFESESNTNTVSRHGMDAAAMFRSGVGKKKGSKPDKGPHIAQFCQFEWWGDFDLKGDGEVVPCVITVVLPAEGNRPWFAGPFKARKDYPEPIFPPEEAVCLPPRSEERGCGV